MLSTETDASTLWELFASTLEAEPQAVAIIDAASTYTRSDVGRQVEALDSQMDALGVERGSFVLAEASNSLATVIVGLASSRRGAIFCPLSPRLGIQEINSIERVLAPSVVISSQPRGDGWLQAPNCLQTQQRIYWTNKFLADQSKTFEPMPARSPDVSLIGFTGGTTGVPKAVQQTERSIIYATSNCARIAGLEPGDPILAAAPFGSGPGYAFTVHIALSYGMPLVIMPSWDPVAALEAIRRHTVRWFMCVPAHLEMLLRVVRNGGPLRASAA